jgi:hypothetical protein
MHQHDKFPNSRRLRFRLIWNGFLGRKAHNWPAFAYHWIGEYKNYRNCRHATTSKRHSGNPVVFARRITSGSSCVATNTTSDLLCQPHRRVDCASNRNTWLSPRGFRIVKPGVGVAAESIADAQTGATSCPKESEEVNGRKRCFSGNAMVLYKSSESHEDNDLWVKTIW